MHFFEKKLGLLLLLFSLPLLFLPKINLISFQSETAGLRIDDLVLLLIGSLLFWTHLILHKKLYRIELWMLAITLFGMASLISNRILVTAGILHVDAKIFYTIRILEYFIFFYIGALSAQYLSGKKVIQAFFVWNLLLMILQKLNLTGAVTVEGYASDVSVRVQGVASFPSEMGLILNLLFCYFVFDEESKSKIARLFPPIYREVAHQLYPYWMFTLFGIFVIFTGNRISILALVICFLFKLKEVFSWKSIAPLLALTALVPLVAGIIWLISSTDSVYSRSSELFSFNNIKLIGVVWDEIDISQDPMENDLGLTENYDMSWWIRLHKWIYIAKVYVTHPECYLQGLGPGVAWSALDGGLLRIFFEYGLIGSWIFWMFFSTLARINTQLKWMVIAFGINMIFFDAYLAYKAMSLLFFVGGDRSIVEKAEIRAKGKGLKAKIAFKEFV